MNLRRKDFLRIIKKVGIIPAEFEHYLGRYSSIPFVLIAWNVLFYLFYFDFKII